MDLQPDVDEVLQAEPAEDLTTVPVCVQEIKAPVRVQQLPRKAGATRTRAVGDTAAVRVLTADHHRAQVTIVSASAFLVAFAEAAAQDDSTMAWWPATVPLVVGTTTEVWLKAETGTAEVSIVTELWAAGR